MTFVEAAKQVLRENGNVPMTAREIWSVVSEREMHDSAGKTPIASMNAVLLRNSSNSNTNIHNSDTFRQVGERPTKFQLNRYVPRMVKESLLEDGFVDREVLERRISDLEKRNSDLEKMLSNICEKFDIK